VTLCKIATQVKQDKDRILLQLPSACPVQALLPRGTTLLYVGPLPVEDTSGEGSWLGLGFLPGRKEL
jgi:hypothetical protein